MKRLITVAAIILVASLSFGSASLAQSKPEFKLGFHALAGQIPSIVGEPIESEHWGANGDSLQMTTSGLMVWRKADNWTAFTDGSRTWINGPRGVQVRENIQRFDWEPREAGTQPVPTPTPTPAPTPTITAPSGSSGSGGYRNVDGNWVPSPGSNPAGATAQCRDGTYSYSQHRQGTCSHHGGVLRWLR